MIVHPGSNFSSELFSLPCLWFEGKKFSWEKIYIQVCFHQWKHVGAKITFRRSFFSYMIFPFCRVKVSKTIFSEELNQIFSVCFLKFFFFFSFQEILWTSEYNRINTIFIFFRCLKSCGKNELFFMGNWIKIYFPYKLREKSFKRNFFFKLVNFPKLIFSTKLIFFFLTKICNFLCHFLLFFWHVKNLHLEFFRRNFSCESQ